MSMKYELLKPVVHKVIVVAARGLEFLITGKLCQAVNKLQLATREITTLIIIFIPLACPVLPVQITLPIMVYLNVIINGPSLLH